jgi:putative membrane protein
VSNLSPVSPAPAPGWRRLHPLSPLVRVGGPLGGLLVLAITGARRHGNYTAVLFEVGIIVVLGLLGFISWLVTRWRIEGGVLRIESGLLRRTSRRFPADQIQAVDTVRPVLARAFGLAEVRVRMAASTGQQGRLSYLADAEAEEVRARLLALAHGVAENAPPPPEQVLITTPTARLIPAILLSGIGLVLEAVIVALVILVVLIPSAVGPALSATATALLGLVASVFRRLNSDYHLTVAEAPDGLRLRSGLVQTAAETIPRGRVQGVRMVEPWLWRPFGWCRLVVDVAGKQRSGRESRSISEALRTVLPVGSKEQAAWLLERILPGVPAHRSPPPPRARWKSPLRYRYLSWGGDRSYAVTTSGRIRRVTDWVPLAKVQSIRLVEGPWQRGLRLATVHLDTAGRSIHAALRDRSRAECDELVSTLPGLCRAARAEAAARAPGAGTTAVAGLAVIAAGAGTGAGPGSHPGASPSG